MRWIQAVASGAQNHEASDRFAPMPGRIGLPAEGGLGIVSGAKRGRRGEIRSFKLFSSPGLLTAMANELALFGGEPVRRKPFASRQTITEAEKKAASEVLDSGCLSGFFGGPGPGFLGGAKVREFERRWAEAFDYEHAISVNSWTSGLMASVGALGLGPGDEVVCSPFTMSASATCALFYGAIPVFADIDPESFCLDPASVERAVTARTKSIIVVHLFGAPADMDGILAVAKKYNLKVIEDAAQAPGARYAGRHVGAIGDIGGFSLNYHKHIHTGEGGMIVTDDDDLAQRCQLIRNHGENLIEHHGLEDIGNVIGGNFRLTELQAAIGIVQLERLEEIVAHRQRLAAHLSRRLAGIPGITPPTAPNHATHAFYVYPIKYNSSLIGVPRRRFIEAVAAELPEAATSDDIALSGGYVRPLYLNPIYQRRVAIGSNGFPFNINPNVRYSYDKGLCPVAEHMYETECMISFLVRDPLSEKDMDDFADAIEKVVENIDALRTGT